VQGTAQRWLVLELTDSPWFLGILGAVSGLPMLLFAFLGGWLADRGSRVPVLIAAQALVLSQALAFGWLVQTDRIGVAAVLGLAFAMGSGMALEVPARQTLVYDLVGKTRITNALALHSTVFNLARFAGPALAGVLMGVVSLEACFYFKAVSAAVILGILSALRRRIDRMRLGPGGQSRRPGLLQAWGKTLEFARETPVVRSVLLLILTFGVLVLPYTVLLPSLGRDILGLDAMQYGFLCAANGLGALCGAIGVAVWGHRGQRERWWWSGSFLFPFSLVALAAAPSYKGAAAMLFLAGCAMVITANSALSLLQLAATDAVRGQVMGLFTTSFMGAFPLGSLLYGAAAQSFGVRTTLAAAPAVALAVACAVRSRFGRLPRDQ